MDNYKTIITFTLIQHDFTPKSFLKLVDIETFIKYGLTVQVHPFYSNAI